MVVGRRYVHRALAGSCAMAAALLLPSMPAIAASANVPLLYINAGPSPTGVHAGSDETVADFLHQGNVLGPVVSGKSIAFRVISGPDVGKHGTVVTDASGEALWRYSTAASVPAGGSDTVRSWVDANSNGRFDAGEVSRTQVFFVATAPTGHPLAGSVQLDFSENTTADIDLPASDPQGQSISISIVTPPTHGTLVQPAIGTVIYYTPDSNFTGTDSFVYQVRNAGGQTAQNQVRLTVEPQIPPEGRAISSNQNPAGPATGTPVKPSVRTANVSHPNPTCEIDIKVGDSNYLLPPTFGRLMALFFGGRWPY